MTYSQSRSPDSPVVDFSQTQDLPLLPQSESIQTLWQNTLGWQPSASQWQLFQRVYHGTLIGNRLFNLTRITDPDEFLEKHLWDSLRGIRGLQPTLASNSIAPDSIAPNSDTELDGNTNLPTPTRVIDIGSGAGFPGLPVAIAQPDWQVTLLDATRKKTTFLDALRDELALPHVTTLTQRAEAAGRLSAHREQYDLALLRAVAPAAVCAEYALPLLRIGGQAILYRGHWTEDETSALRPVVELLGGELAHIEAFQTPFTSGDRHCVVLKKVSATSTQFPRANGVPNQKPLGQSK
ncbi:MAG: 16S rRNA (guanine(527)-N(7))-methyltransferase RsmG [Elainellaceae cyanobacterium]